MLVVTTVIAILISTLGVIFVVVSVVSRTHI